MTDCKDLAKTLIAKQIISNDGFVKVVDDIAKKIDGLNLLGNSPAVKKRLDSLDEALELAYTTTILDLPRGEIVRNNVIRKIDKKLSGKELLENKKQLFYVIESIKNGEGAIDEGQLDSLLSDFDVSKEEFTSFLSNVSSVANKKITLEYLAEKNYNLSAVFGLDESEVKKILKKGGLQKLIEEEGVKLDEYLTSLNKEFNKMLTPTEGLKGDDLKRANAANQKVVSEKQYLINNYLIAKSLNGNLEPDDLKNLLDNVLGTAGYKSNAVDISDLKYTEDKVKGITKIIIPGPEGSLPGEAVIKFDKEGDPIIDIMGAPRMAVAAKEEKGMLDDLVEKKPVGEKITGTGTTRKIVERIREQGYTSFKTTSTTNDGQGALDSLIKKGVISYDAKNKVYTIESQARNFGEVNQSTINSMSTVDELRDLLYMYLPNFKDKYLLKAFNDRVDALNFGDDIQIKKTLDELERLKADPINVVGSLLDLIKKDRKKPVRAKKTDKKNITDVILQKVSGKGTEGGDIYFYERELPVDDISLAAREMYKKYSVKVGDVKGVIKNQGELSSDMNVVVDNITTAKTINEFSPIFPNVFGNNKTLGFFVEDGKLYVGAGNESDYQELLNVLDDVDIDVGDVSGADQIIAGYKLRYGDNYEEAIKILKKFSNSDNILVQSKYLEKLGEIDPSFEVWVGDKKAIIDSLPNDISFYYNEAVKYARRFGITLPEKIELGDVLTAKTLYADLMIVDTDSIGSWSDMMSEYLELFGSTGKVVNESNKIAVYIKTVDSIIKDGYNLPSARFNNVFGKIERGENIGGDIFVSQFISKNRDKLASIEGFTEIDKVKNYLVNKFTEQKNKTTNGVASRKPTVAGYGLYMRRTDNSYVDLLPDDLDFRLIQGGSETISKDFGLIKELLNKYVKDVEDLIGKQTLDNGYVTEQEMYLLSRRAQRAIAKYEEEFLLPRYEGLLLNNQILGNRYDAIKVTSIDDIELLKNKVSEVSKELDNLVNDFGEQKVEVNLTEAKKTLEERGVAFVKLSKNKTTSIRIDDLIRKELLTSKGDIKSIDNLDLTQFTNKEKFELLANIKAIKLSPKTGNVLVQMYEAIFPALRGFFDSYEMVDTYIDAGSNGEKVKLPKLLARTNAFSMYGDGTLVPDVDDLVIKKSILEEISPKIRSGELNSADLEDIVGKNVDQYLAVDSFSRLYDGFPRADVVKAYVEQFKPYLLLVGIPQEFVDDFSKGVLSRMGVLGDVPLSAINVTVDGKAVPLSQAIKAPETSFPNVIYGEQRFYKPTIDRNGEQFIKDLENDIKLARDQIEKSVDDLDNIQSNIFGEVSVILDKSPRLKQMKEVILGNDSAAKGAGKIIERISSKEQLVAIQGNVRTFMDMTDEQFEAFSKSDISQVHVGEAVRIAEYFRLMNKGMSKIPVDQGMRDVFNNFQDRFLKLKASDIGMTTKGLGISISNHEIFKIVPYKATSQFQQQAGILGLANRLEDEVELNFFNESFQSNLSMQDFQRVMLALSDLNLNGLLQRAVRLNDNIMKRWLGGRITRFMTSRPFGVLTLPQQILGYKTLEKNLEKIVGTHDWDKAEKLRRDYALLSGEIPEIDVNSALGKLTSILSKGFNKGGVPGLQQQLADLRASNLSYVFDAVKDNANNLIDVFFSRSIKNRAFVDGVMNNGYRTFYSLDEFEAFMKDAPLAEKQKLISEIDRVASRQFENLMGFSQNALFRSTNSGVLASMLKIFETTTGFRSGWGLNMAKRGFKKLTRGGDVGLYIARNGFSQEAIDNGVNYFMKDRDVSVFFSTMMYDMYYATKLKRYIETRDENEDNESFFNFIGNELTDIKGWQETLMAMSQGVQALYSAGPLRPLIFGLETQLGLRDGTAEAAFLEGLKGAAFRQFKLVNNLVAGGANLAGEAMSNGLEYDGVFDNSVVDAVVDLMRQTSAGTLRYMMMDRDYQKNLFYIPDTEGSFETVLGVNLNPYAEAEARMASIANSTKLQENPGKAMLDLIYGTYAGKLFNNLKYIGRSMYYGNFSSKYNMSNKYDFAEVIEANPVYAEFVNSGKLDLNQVPEQYRQDVYKRVAKQLGSSGYILGGSKQDDAIDEYLMNSKNEEWREKQKSMGGVARANMEIMDFISLEDVQYLKNTLMSVKGKGWNANKKEEFVYNFVKERINAVELKDRPYGYFFLDTAHFLTRDVPTKNLSKMEQELIRQQRTNMVLNTFMDREAFELEQGIYKDVRDDMVLEAMYRADQEAFKPFFSVTYDDYGNAKVNFDSSYKSFFDGMTQTLMKAEEGDLNGFEVAFSNVVKAYKDQPESAIAVYNELNKFLEGRNDIENKDDMLNWFLIKNSELLEDPELLKERIGVDMYNELLFNIKKREDEINSELQAFTGGSGGGKKPKASSFKFAGLKAFEKLSKATGTQPRAPSYASSTGKTPKISYGNSKSGEGIAKSKSTQKSYSAQSVSIWGEKTKGDKDIKRTVKSLKRKILSEKSLGIKKTP